MYDNGSSFHTSTPTASGHRYATFMKKKKMSRLEKKSSAVTFFDWLMVLIG
jgi:hypothetical protein